MAESISGARGRRQSSKSCGKRRAAVVSPRRIIPDLAAAAAERLRLLAIDNVEIHCADGYQGWPRNAPYDGIIVTAGAPRVPPALPAQLKAGGRMIIPVGEAHGFQELLLIEKSEDGAPASRAVLPVAFVPLTRSGMAG